MVVLTAERVSLLHGREQSLTDAVVLRWVQKTKGTAMAMAELEQRQLSSPNDVVRAWATAAQERRMNPGAEEELDESEADDAGVGETGPGVAES